MENQQQVQNISSPNSDEKCAFCLETVQLRGGGVPLYSPGCCGKLFHQKCIVEYVNSERNRTSARCPSCRFSFEVPSYLRQTQSPVNAVAVPPPVLLSSARISPPPVLSSASNLSPYWSTIGNMFGNVVPRTLRSNRIPLNLVDSTPSIEMTEDVLPDAFTHSSDFQTAQERNILTLQSSISIAMTPEYSAIGLDEKESFHVRVGVQYSDNRHKGELPVKNSKEVDVQMIAKADDIPSNIIYPLAQILPPPSIALDIVCVLDNSGSMTGSKISSLKTAMNFVIKSLGPNDRFKKLNYRVHYCISN